MPFFPDIPLVPGVPPLLRDPSSLPGLVTPLIGDVIGALAGLFGQQWGLFLGGVPAVVAESVLSFDFRQDYNLATFQIEEGGFETYDKVQMPYNVRFRFMSGASAEARQILEESAAAAVASLELFDAVTPEKVYTSVNPIHYDFKRTNISGVGLLILDIHCMQVRVNTATTFSDTKSPSAAGTANGGTVQTSEPTAAQLATLSSSTPESL